MRWICFSLSLMACNGFAFDLKHTVWTQLLHDIVVTSGPQTLIPYESLKLQPQYLNEYIRELGAVTQQEYNQWMVKDQVAFLINAYNALTIKTVVDHYPIRSIKKIGWWPFQNAWNQDFFNLLGKRRTLTWIEEDMLRKEFGDPRIHFALATATLSGPKLRNEAYVGSTLDEQLNDSKQQFLKDETKNIYVKSSKILKVSELFRWYMDDFGGPDLLKRFLIQEMQVQDDANSVQLQYLPFDWEINALPLNPF